MDIAHIERVKSELRKAGVTRYGLLKGESRKLPQIIHPEEHIHAAVYGRCQQGSAMLVATERRVIFIDWKPLYTTSDEISYDVIAGVTYGQQGLVSTVTLHSRIGDYQLRYVNIGVARKFVAYMEKRQLEHTKNGNSQKRPTAEPLSNTVLLDAEITRFLEQHELATLSTLDRSGNVHGASVYYTYTGGFIYVLTKELTNKARNILVHSQVALTVTDEQALKTLELEGLAEVETDLLARQQAFNKITKERVYQDGRKLPPVTNLEAGSFVVIRIAPKLAELNDYHHKIFRI